MRGAESIIDVDIGQSSQLLRHFGIVLLFFGMEAGIFEQENLPRLERFGGFFRSRPDAILGESHRLAGQLAQVSSDRFQRILGVGAILGSSQVGAQDNRCTPLEQIFERGQRGADAGIVAHRAVFNWDIEIHAHKNALALRINVSYSLFVHSIL